MGLFGSSDEPDPKAEELAKKAKGDYVTAEKLTKTEQGGLTSPGPDYFANSCVLDWLDEDEQPHFLFVSDSIDGHEVQRLRSSNIESEDYRVVTVITDKRILILSGKEPEAEEYTISYDEIESVGQRNTKEGVSKVGVIIIETIDDLYYIKHNQSQGEKISASVHDTPDAAQYISEKSEIDTISNEVSIFVPEEGVEDILVEYASDSLDEHVNIFGDDINYVSDIENFDMSDATEYGGNVIYDSLVTEEELKQIQNRLRDDNEWFIKKVDKEKVDRLEQRVETVTDLITDNEKGGVEEKLGRVKKEVRDSETIEYVISGSRVESESHTGTESLTSTWNINNEKTKTVVTDERVLIVVPQRMSTEKRTITYDEITGVDIKTGRIQTKINIRTHSIVWDIWIDERKKAEEALEYIREKKQEAKQQPTQSDDSQEDPTEQLKKIKELHDEGILSDEEFEEKKEELIARI